MHNFSTLLLRSYYQAIGWNEDNLYSNLTRSSSAILDFPIPTSLTLQLSNAPTPIFFTSYGLDFLPQLNGSISYITTSLPLSSVIPSFSSNSISLRNATEGFKVHPIPRRPTRGEEVWQGGELLPDPREYLLYSRLHLPSLHLSALATTRFTPTLQGHLAFLHRPAVGISAPQRSASSLNSSNSSTNVSSSNNANNPSSMPREPPPQLAPPPSPPGNLLLSLQHDTGRWSTEYTYSATDGMFGFRSLYNFGLTEGNLVGNGFNHASSPSTSVPEVIPSTNTLVSGSVDASSTAVTPMRWDDTEKKRVDEEEGMEGGLRGRFSAGGEVYFSAKQRSFGISTGVRFTTIPSPAAPPSTSTSLSSPPSNLPHPSPPTTLTLLYNPLIGFLSTSYAAQISPHLSLATRFGVNVYSYESEWWVGGEWWIGSGRGKGGFRGLGTGGTREREREVLVSKVRETEDLVPQLYQPQPQPQKFGRMETEPGMERFGRLLENKLSTSEEVEGAPVVLNGKAERDGVLRARLSGDGLISLLYEARIRKCLVSMGVSTDLTSRSTPVRGLGMDIQYFSGE